MPRLSSTPRRRMPATTDRSAAANQLASSGSWSTVHAVSGTCSTRSPQRRQSTLVGKALRLTPDVEAVVVVAAEAVVASVAGEREEAAKSFPQRVPPEREAVVVAAVEVAAG